MTLNEAAGGHAATAAASRAYKPPAIISERSVVFIAGITGTGKTSLARRLLKLGPVYLEDVQRNPVFSFTAPNARNRNVQRSQKWFLDEIALHLQRSTGPVCIIDQHPLVVSHVYGRFLCAKGHLSRRAQRELEGQAQGLMGRVISESRTLTLCLTATTTTVRERLRKRDTSVPATADIRHLNRLFAELVLPGPCVVVNTEEASSRREQHLVERWLRKPKKGLDELPRVPLVAD